MSLEKKEKYRILLLRPFFEMLEHELVFLPFEPLGLMYLQSALSKAGHEVKLYDCPVEHPRKIKFSAEKQAFLCGSDEKDIVKEIKKFKPDIVCISGMFYSQSSSFYRIASLVKSISTETIVVGGGAFPSAYGDGVFRDNKNIDFIVVGEGERTILELINNLNHPDKVKGIIFRKDEKIIFTGETSANMELDLIDFPHRDFSKIYNYSKPVGYNYSKKLNLKKIIKSSILYSCLSVPGLRFVFAYCFNLRHKKNLKALLMPCGFIITSRGCPSRCSFCAIHKVWGGIYRIRSAVNVLAEIEELVRHGVKEIVIVDDNFTVSRERTIEICRGIIDKGWKIRLLTPSGVFLPSLDKEVLQYLFRAGLRELQFGVENGDQEFLEKVIKKNLKLEKVKEIVAQAKEIGFKVRGFFIFGYPGETREIMIKTLRFAFESGMNSARFYVFQPLPGTEAWQLAKNMGAIDNKLDFSKLKMRPDVPVVETKDFSKKDVMEIFNLAYDILQKKNYEEVKNKIPQILGWDKNKPTNR